MRIWVVFCFSAAFGLSVLNVLFFVQPGIGIFLAGAAIFVALLISYPLTFSIRLRALEK